tara:strand:+ start:74 stop:823 length:750 start_codon:yes stop_codon:yes gene_type:complete
MKKISIVIPCYNEEKGISQVIQTIPKTKLRKLGYNTEILVIDNNSKDKTAQMAKQAGADKILFEKKQGKGYALINGFRNLSDSTDFVVMLDGDNTYKAKEMLRLIEPLENDFCDVIIGTRLAGKIQKGSMTTFNRIGNWFFTFLVRTVYCENVTDVCTGYFAWKREVIEELRKHVQSNGFSIEMEMIAKMSKLNYSIYSVPITYEDRAGSTNLKPVQDGIRILRAWGRNLFWKPNYCRGKKKEACPAMA